MALDLSGKFMLGLLFATLSFVATLVSYASPHWVESFPKSNNPFLNAGIWEICWNDYTFPKDLIGRRFIGCFWVLGRDLYEFRDNILQGVYIAVIVVFTVQLSVQVVSSVVIIVSWFKIFPQSIRYGITRGIAVALLAAATLSFMGLILFGVLKEDREWMYRPDQNILSWAYGVAALGMIFNLIASLFFYLVSKRQYSERNKLVGGYM